MASILFFLHLQVFLIPHCLTFYQSMMCMYFVILEGNQFIYKRLEQENLVKHRLAFLVGMKTLHSAASLGKSMKSVSAVLKEKGGQSSAYEVIVQLYLKENEVSVQLCRQTSEEFSAQLPVK